MRLLFFFLLVSTFATTSARDIDQVRLDIYRYREPVYFCFTKDTYQISEKISSLSKDNLNKFQAYLRENLRYNFIFHLENHNKKWEDLARTQHGIQYTMVCDLTMDFGIHSTLTLYYQDPINDMYWEQIYSATTKINSPENWISNSAKILSDKIKKIVPVPENLERRIKEVEDTLGKIGTSKDFSTEIEKIELENDNLKSKIGELEFSIEENQRLLKKIDEELQKRDELINNQQRYIQDLQNQVQLLSSSEKKDYFESDWFPVSASKEDEIFHGLGTDRFSNFQFVLRESKERNDEIIFQGMSSLRNYEHEAGIVFYIDKSDDPNNKIKWLTASTWMAVLPWASTSKKKLNWSIRSITKGEVKVRIWR